MLALGLAGFGAGRGLCCVNDFGVALGGNLFLRFDNRSADRAADAIRQTRFGAGRRLAHNGLLSVAGRRDLSLRNDDCVADGAVLALGLAGFGAGRSLCCVNDFGVALGGNLFLRFDNRSADRAADAIRQTRFGAGRRLAHNSLLSVAGRGDLFHTGDRSAADRTLRTRSMTGLSAGSGLFRNFNQSMSSCIDCFGLGCIANCAGVGLGTGVLTGSGGGDHALIPAVALSLNSFALGDFLAADGADCITGVAVLGAGGILLVDHLGERMFVCPAGLEGQIGKSKQFWLCPRLIIEFFLFFIPDAHLDHAGNQPAIEGVTLASKATFGKRVILAGRAVDDLYRSHRTAAAVGIKSDGELLKFVEFCPEVNVLMRVEAPAVDPLRLIIGIPAIRKDVGIVLILGSARGFVVPIIPFSRFLAGVVALLQDCVVPVQPADMVLVQRPLGVEGDIFVGGDVCLVGIGRAGAVLRRVPTGEVIVRAGEGVGGQGGRLIGLHGLGTHGALAIIGHKGNDRVLGPLGIQGGVRVEAHALFVGIVRTGALCLGIPAGEGVAFAGKGVLWQIKTHIGPTCQGRHRSFAAVGVKANSDVRSTAPYATQIGNGRTRAGICRLGVGAVCVVQLRRGNGNLMGYYWFSIFILIRFGLRAGCPLLNIHAASTAGADVRAAGRGVDVTTRSHCSVDVNLCIFEGCTLACPAGSIGHRDVCDIFNAAIATPLIHIIDIKARSTGYYQFGIFFDCYFHAREQCSRLVHGQFAARGQINSHIVGKWQNIAAGINIQARQR